MRSTFKDWVAERTGYPNEVSEAALWHEVSGKVEAAYRRGDLSGDGGTGSSKSLTLIAKD